MRHGWPRLLMLVVLAGCSGADDASRPGSAAAPPATFVLVDEPEVTIGVTKGETPYLLNRVSDATRLSDGRIVVANCSSGELRYFDPTGLFLRAVGGLGEGPGEFTWLWRIFPAGGDSVGVYDAGQIRVTIFGPDGGLVRTVSVGDFTPQGRPNVIGRLADGSFVARRNRSDPPDAAGTPYRTTASILLLDDAGQVLDSLPDLPSSDVMAMGPRGPNFSLRFSRRAVFAVQPDRIFYGGQDEAGLLEFDAALDLVHATSPVTRPEPVTDGTRAAFQAMRDQGTLVAPDGVGPALTGEYAPMMPAFGDLVAGRDGRLWVEDPFRPPVHPLVWTAYEDGEAVARLEIPPRFFPFEFGRDWVLGVSYDALTVERVELHRMVPGELPGRRLPPRDAEPPAIPRCSAWASR